MRARTARGCYGGLLMASLIFSAARAQHRGDPAGISILDETALLTKRGRCRSHSRGLRRARNKNDPFQLTDFGHRVYKRQDPQETRSAPQGVAPPLLGGPRRLEAPLVQVGLAPI